MEKIKVNMSPNPLDVQTIHASQNDSEAREWGFELHNNGDVIDSSEISDQLVFKAYKGGTEQLLPENGSTPTTSPFIGDIRYPQGLLADQEFTYRQSPTEEDGLAKITDIKGNTLVWNQLNTNIGGSETYHDVSFTKNDDGSWTINGTPNGTNTFVNINYSPSESQRLKLIQGHKYYVKGANYDLGVTIRFYYFSHGTDMLIINNELIFESLYDDTSWMRWQVTDNFTVNNYKGYPQIFDLTMLGIDNLTLDEVKQWFADYYPLPYYQYDSGSLLPFRGEGLKTVGKNLLDKTSFIESTNVKLEQTSTGVKAISKNGIAYGSVSTVVISNLTPFIGKTFVLSANVQTSNRPGLALQVRDENNVEKAWRATTVTGSTFVTLTITDDFRGCHLRVAIYANCSSSGAVGDYSIYDNLQVEFGTTPSSYEPYTSSTLSLPISTYFPTGMKSAGTVYDELTPTKGITRIGAVDLGSLIWSYDSTHALFFSSQLSDSVPVEYTAMPNIICASYTTVKGSGYNSGIDKSISINDIYGIKRVTAKDSSYTDGSTFKNSLSGVYLYYELATPTETSFTTASLVTENAEITLSNEDGVLIGKCTEELSAEPGFHDAKIKLSDGDGTCYSNKLQLHVERSPQ